MSTNVAIVDEQDPLIHYDEVVQQGSTASFAFVGSSVTVYGSVAANASQASLGFSVDNSLTGSYSPPSGSCTTLFHEAFWISPPLNEGHTLFCCPSLLST
ncbi:hypothetical protein DFH07DRAFT_968604 [Mycena maculata]|uniref:Uncharacterized protein n=1 Tax=Mycena maculata TaxID=230809 RepID=A0AAD7MT20_9AGAR|nr:hypothetical protein DFH07DRAFT_968604 [Mycena maculata]